MFQESVGQWFNRVVDSGSRACWTMVRSLTILKLTHWVRDTPHLVIQANRTKGILKGLCGNEDVQSAERTARPAQPYTTC